MKGVQDRSIVVNDQIFYIFWIRWAI